MPRGSLQLFFEFLGHSGQDDAPLLVRFPVLVRWRSGNEEPLVDAGVDGSRSMIFTRRDVELVGVGAVLRVRDASIGTAAC